MDEPVDPGMPPDWRTFDADGDGGLTPEEETSFHAALDAWSDEKLQPAARVYDRLPPVMQDEGRVRWRDAERLGWEVPPPHVHHLRHAAATLLFASGASPREVQDALGHTDPRLTLAIYAGVLDQMAEAAAARMDEMIATADASEAKVVSLPR